MYLHHERKLAIVGLGYVGLPLAVAFGEVRDTLGFDINAKRIEELNNHFDATRECTTDEIAAAKHLKFSNAVEDLAKADIYIIAVPTPVTTAKVPDLTPAKSASVSVGGILKKGDIVIYESTVYPGATEEEMIPILEKTSGLKFNSDFFVGYSPERINPGDKNRGLKNIVKVTSGSTPEIAELIDQIYGTIIKAGTHKAESIQVAEAAKVIENIQRDVNIALINELSAIFGRLGLSTRAVLEAARTKWNFLPFEPGLVGGHCIGVDPYYLTHKANMIDFHPDIILAGRRTNDRVSRRISDETLLELSKNGVPSAESKVLVLGFTFKENCPDLRNTKVFDVVLRLKSFGCDVCVHDPVADTEEALEEYNCKITKNIPNEKFDAIIIAVKHDEYIAMGDKAVDRLLKTSGFVYDVKWAFPHRADYVSL
jgi:UDP-N-acetyl-D-galactosamine dehydrogenase